MPKVFISYRREDSEFAVDPIYGKLASHFGTDSVFMDVDTIPPGVDFRQYLNDEVRQCDVLLAVIGRHWLDVRKADGSRRLEDPADFVRIEIQAALSRGIPVVPVLLGDVSMPRSDQLPPELADLPYRNAVEVRRGKDFETHLDRLVHGVERALETVRKRQPQKGGLAKKPTGRPRHHEPDLVLFVCPQCGAKLKLAKKLTGKRLFCPQCGHPSRVGERAGSEPTGAHERRVKNSVGIELVLIPPGEFLMGSPETEEGRWDDEHQHLVQITKPFYLGVCQVTQGQWQRVMGTTPWRESAGVNRGDDYPATYVSWDDAMEFCRKLTESERTASGLPPGWQYTLPSEAQWEYACRAGTTSRYYFGDDASRLGQYAWFDKNAWDAGEKYAHQVGLKQPNTWGLYDMHGNVWEWCLDWYHHRAPGGPDPIATKKASDRVFRGGSWGNSAVLCRVAGRGGGGPGYRRGNLGFRLAAVQSEGEPKQASS